MFSRLLFKTFGGVYSTIPLLLSDENPSFSLSDNNASALISNSYKHAISFSSSAPATKTSQERFAILNILWHSHSQTATDHICFQGTDKQPQKYSYECKNFSLEEGLSSSNISLLEGEKFNSRKYKQ